MKTSDSIAGDLLEATRLTRAGRLRDATALIQRFLRGRAGTEAVDPYGGGRVIDADASVVDPARVEAPARIAPPRARARTGTVDAPPGAFIAASFTNHAGTRPYKLYVPSGYAGEALPLVVMLHGCTQSADDFAAGTRMNARAEERRCLVLYPEQIQAANRSRCWNWFRRADQGRDAGEPAIIAGMSRDVRDRYGVDARKVFVAGLSAGGAMAAVVGSAYPELFAAIGVHSGLAHGAAHDLPSALAAMRGTHAGSAARASGAKVPVIVFHGDRDKTVHPSNGERVVAQSAAGPGAGGTITVERDRVPAGHAYTRTIHRDATGRIVLEHWLVAGGGHAWFGGSEGGSFTDPRGPDATRELLRFFGDAAR